jgi:hypothetical protein
MPLPSLTIETGGGVEVSTNPAKGAPTTGDSIRRLVALTELALRHPLATRMITSL